MDDPHRVPECYLLTMLLGLAGLLRRRAVVFVLFAGAMLLHTASTLEPVDPFASFPIFMQGPLGAHPRMAAYFLAGTILALYRTEWEPRRTLVIASALALAVTALAGGFQIVAPIAFTYLVFAFAFAPRPIFIGLLEEVTSRTASTCTVGRFSRW